MFATAQEAGKYASVEEFTQVSQKQGGWITSRAKLLSRPNVWLIAFWGKYSLSLLPDGRLMMVVGQVAYEVKVSRETLEAVFAPHLNSKWWK